MAWESPCVPLARPDRADVKDTERRTAFTAGTYWHGANGIFPPAQVAAHLPPWRGVGPRPEPFSRAFPHSCLPKGMPCHSRHNGPLRQIMTRRSGGREQVFPHSRILPSYRTIRGIRKQKGRLLSSTVCSRTLPRAKFFYNNLFILIFFIFQRLKPVGGARPQA
ncbi:hypothetical protein CNY67_00825 [Desulfovibrio sp. G11]|nr:hypothetical protein CNY67_00825 [Desulfovibrio sp. G11]